MLYEVITELFPYIESIESEIKRDLCLGTLAENLGIESKSLLFELNRQKKNNSRNTIKKNPTQLQDQKMTDELLAVMAAALHREFLPKIKHYNVITSYSIHYTKLYELPEKR